MTEAEAILIEKRLTRLETTQYIQMALLVGLMTIVLMH